MTAFEIIARIVFALVVSASAVGGIVLFFLRRAHSDTLNNTTDEHAQRENFGFEAGTFHARSNSYRERNEHV